MRQQLWRYYPQFLHAVDDDVAAPWALELWRSLPTPRAGQRVRGVTLTRVLKQHRIRRIDAATLRDRLRAPAVKLTPGTTEAATAHVRLLVERLALLNRQLAHADRQLDRLVINDNYSCRLTRMRSAGSWMHREACDTARFPLGGRFGHGCAGATIAREADVREDVGGGRSGGGNARADGAPLAERRVAVDGEGAADVADAGGPVRRRVAVGGRAAFGGGYGGTAAGTDAVQVAVPAASGSLSAGAATDVAAAGPGVAGAGRSGSRSLLRAGGGPGPGSGFRLHRRAFAAGDDSG